MVPTTPATPTVPGFTLDRLIGEGGFGQVWRASRDAPRELVAIKILHFELISSNDAMTRFQREVAAVERLQHPNVVRAFEHGTLADGRPYLVMEYLDGASLREVIRERGAFSPEDMLAVFGPLCDALAVAHAASLVHRDIKASNVVIAKAGDRGAPRPVLLDFGLVKLIDDVGPGLTSSRTMLGTPTAMAPEQMRGEPVDARTDVYALGLLAYHMLTGIPAFTAGGGAIKSYLQLHGPRPRPSSKIDIDPAIDKPVMKALAPTPADRYATPKDFLDALTGAIRTRGTAPFARESTPVMETAVEPSVSPAPGVEAVVIALYVEADRDEVTRIRNIATRIGMTIAISAPDSILAIIPVDVCPLARLKEDLSNSTTVGRIALGRSRAAIHEHIIDGPALDAESWAPYPLPEGLWIAPDL